MKNPLLLLILLAAGNIWGEYRVGKKGDFWNTYSAERACLNLAGDSITLVHQDERTAIPLDSVGYMTFRERKSWAPYLLSAGIVGGSTYALLHFFARDDAMYSAEGKARFMGVLSGFTVLLFGAILKEPMETNLLINPKLGIHEVGALVICEF